MRWNELSERWEILLRKAQRRSDLVCALTQMDVHPAQARFLDRRAPSHRQEQSLYTSVLATGRRWGKTQVVAMDALEYALLKPKSRQCILSVSLSQARLAWDEVWRLAQGLIMAPFLTEVKLTPFPLLKLVNGSTITARSSSHDGKYLRGHRFDRLFIDEAEYIKETVIEDVARMTLADVGGELILTTTPRKAGSLIYQIYTGIQQRGAPEEYAQTGSSFENPFIDHRYIHSLQERMSREAWEREILGQWSSGERAVFAWEDIQRAYLGADWELPEPTLPGRRYIAGWDLAKEQDYTVGIVLDATEFPLRVVYFERFHQQPWQVVCDRIEQVHFQYSCDMTTIDSTGVGAVVLDLLSDVARGFTFTKETKTDALYNLQVLLQQGRIRFPFLRQLVDELNAYEWDDRDLTQDCVMALAIACWVASPVAIRGQAVRPSDILVGDA